MKLTFAIYAAPSVALAFMLGGLQVGCGVALVACYIAWLLPAPFTD